jgi:F-type H+-transporting ATPase subunit b
METLIAPTVNLGILIGILVFYLREPLKQFVRTRHDVLRENLEKVATELQGARERHEEFSARISNLQAEVSAMHVQARQDAESMKQKILSEARRLSEVIVMDAKGAAQGLFSEFRAQLRTELGERVLGRAEQLLRERLTGDDRARIRQEFSRQVEKIQ